MMRRVRSIAIAVAGVFALAACTSIDVNKLPAPGNSFQGGYPLVMEFGNVLNLPAHAKVTLDGNLIGVVTDVVVAGDRVDVTARIDAAVSIPSDIHAGLQQDSVLGDIYVALDRPSASGAPGTQASGAPGARVLASGARIPLAQTTSPPQLEDTIAELANFTGSGSIQRLQTTIMGINRITPPPDDIRRIASRFTVDTSDVAKNMDTVDHFLDAVSQTGQALHNRIPELAVLLSPQGQIGWDNAIGTLGYTSNAYPSIAKIYSGGFWLVPLLNSLADATGALQKSKWAFESEVPKWKNLFTGYFLPQDKNPAINITSIVSPDGRELSGNVQDVLRLLGATP
jgi:phospholipid/cholesterol/gamma-HCH transport system substrate-binding protein